MSAERIGGEDLYSNSIEQKAPFGNLITVFLDVGWTLEVGILRYVSGYL